VSKYEAKDTRPAREWEKGDKDTRPAREWEKGDKDTRPAREWEKGDKEVIEDDEGVGAREVQSDEEDSDEGKDDVDYFDLDM
jgi:hypothetical protein